MIRKRPVLQKSTGLGKAYAFIGSECGPDSIRHELNKLKAKPDANIPGNMHVFIHKIGEMGKITLKLDGMEKDLLRLAKVCSAKGANLFVRTMLPYVDNNDAAFTLWRALEFVTMTTNVFGTSRDARAEVYFIDTDGKFVSLNEKKRRDGLCGVEPPNDWKRG